MTTPSGGSFSPLFDPQKPCCGLTGGTLVRHSILQIWFRRPSHIGHSVLVAAKMQLSRYAGGGWQWLAVEASSKHRLRQQTGLLQCGLSSVLTANWQRPSVTWRWQRSTWSGDGENYRKVAHRQLGGINNIKGGERNAGGSIGIWCGRNNFSIQGNSRVAGGANIFGSLIWWCGSNLHSHIFGLLMKQDNYKINA